MIDSPEPHTIGTVFAQRKSVPAFQHPCDSVVATHGGGAGTEKGWHPVESVGQSGFPKGCEA